MTRILSELLRADEPQFRLGLRQLETANGNPSHDIRLTGEILQLTGGKLRELGLDPEDTTPEELYHVLQQRVLADDKRLERRLRTVAATYVSAEANVTAGMVHALQAVAGRGQVLGLKASALKTLLKKQPPKRTQKQLGYRSLDSMLKHEPAASLLAAAYVSESPAWRRGLSDAYRRLKPSDFESRPLRVTTLAGVKGQALAAKIVASQQQTIISLRELGGLVILPLPADRPPAAVLTTLVLALHELNEIRACSSFLKLSQVKADFGAKVQLIARSEAELQASELDRPVAWKLVQRYYGRLIHHFSDELFEPHLTRDDFTWQNVEKSLATIDPSLEFWRNTAHLGLLQKGETVSLNLLDNALSACNQLPYARRLGHNLREALSSELSLRYLKPATVEQAVLGEVQPQLATQPALI